MSAPNEALAEALISAPPRINHRELIETQIRDVSIHINSDTIVRRGPGMRKYSTTVAAMLCHSQEFRYMCQQNGINLSTFDIIVEQAAQRWLAQNNLTPPGKKVIGLLLKIPTPNQVPF